MKKLLKKLAIMCLSTLVFCFTSMGFVACGLFGGDDSSSSSSKPSNSTSSSSTSSVVAPNSSETPNSSDTPNSSEGSGSTSGSIWDDVELFGDHYYLNILLSIVKEPTLHVLLEDFTVDVVGTQKLYDKDGEDLTDEVVYEELTLVGDLELYVTIDENSQPYGQGQFNYSMEEGGYNEGLVMEVLVEDGYLYLYADHSDVGLTYGYEGITVIEVDYLFENLFGGEQSLEAFKQVAASVATILESGEFNDVIKMLESVLNAYKESPVEIPALKTIVELFYNAEEDENGNVVYTIDTTSLKQLNTDLFTLSVGEVVEKYLGEDFYADFKKLVEDAGSMTVGTLLDTLKTSYGFDEETVCALIDYAAGVFGMTEFDSAAMLESYKAYSLADFVYTVYGPTQDDGSGDVELNSSYNSSDYSYSSPDEPSSSYEEGLVLLSEETEMTPAEYYVAFVGQFFDMYESNIAIANVYELLGGSTEYTRMVFNTVNDAIAVLEAYPVSLTVSSEGIVSDVMNGLNNLIGMMIETTYTHVETEEGYVYTLNGEKTLENFDNLFNKTLKENIIAYIGQENFDKLLAEGEKVLTTPMKELSPAINELVKNFFPQEGSYDENKTALQLFNLPMTSEQGEALWAQVLKVLDEKAIEAYVKLVAGESADVTTSVTAAYNAYRPIVEAYSKIGFSFTTTKLGEVISVYGNIDDFDFEAAMDRVLDETIGNGLTDKIVVSANGSLTIDREEGGFAFNKDKVVPLKLNPNDAIAAELGINVDEEGNIVSVNYVGEWSGLQNNSYTEVEEEGVIYRVYSSIYLDRTETCERAIRGYRLYPNCGDWYWLDLYLGDVVRSNYYGTFYFDQDWNLVEEKSNYYYNYSDFVSVDVNWSKIYYNAETGALSYLDPHALDNLTLVEEAPGASGACGISYAKYHCDECDEDVLYEWRVGHNYVATSEVFGESCEDGAIVTYTCTKCDDTYSEIVSYHEAHTVEHIHLSEYGSECGGDIWIYACACGENHEENRWIDCNASPIDCELWVEGAFEGIAEGFDENTDCTTSAAQRSCSDCGFVLRYATYWLPVEGKCAVQEYVVYQLGYNAETNSCVREFVLKGKLRERHTLTTTQMEEEGYVTIRTECSECEGFVDERIEVISVGTYTCEVSEENEYTYKYFLAPTATALYTFESHAYEDVYVTIYDSNGVYAENDDAGENMNFYLAELLLFAGETYIVEVRSYHDTCTIPMTVTVEAIA